MPVPPANAPFEIARGNCGQAGEEYQVMVTVDANGFVTSIVGVCGCSRRSFDVTVTAGGVTRLFNSARGQTVVNRAQLEDVLGPVRWGDPGVSVGARQ